jgi:hypothetical protein
MPAVKTNIKIGARPNDVSIPVRAYLRVRTMGIRDRSPLQNGHVERLIDSRRRECLYHVEVFGEAHLRRVIDADAGYCNVLQRRAHSSVIGKRRADFSERPRPLGMFTRWAAGMWLGEELGGFVPPSHCGDFLVRGTEPQGLAGRLRETYGESTPLLIALTGYGRPEDRERVKLAGFQHHLTKPAGEEDLARLHAPPPQSPPLAGVTRAYSSVQIKGLPIQTH